MAHVKKFNEFLNENMGRGPRKSKLLTGVRVPDWRTTTPEEAAGSAIFSAIRSIGVRWNWALPPDLRHSDDEEMIPEEEMIPLEWENIYRELQEAGKIVDEETGTGIRSRQDFEQVYRAIENYVNLLEETEQEYFDEEGQYAFSEYDINALQLSLRALDVLDGMGAKF